MQTPLPRNQHRKNKQPLHVLIVSSEYPPYSKGGLGTHVFELARGLVAAGSRVTVLVMATYEMVTEDKGVTVHFLNALKTSKNLGHLFQIANDEVVKAGERLALSEHGIPDLIHYHDWHGVPASQTLAARWQRPYLGSVHLFEQPIKTWWGDTLNPFICIQERKAFVETPHLITVSESMRQILENYHHLPANRIHVVYNGMNLDHFLEPPEDPEVLPKLRKMVAKDDEKVIMLAGRMSRQKGMMEFFEAAGEVTRVYEKARYVLVGGPLPEPLQDELTELYGRYPHLKAKVRVLSRMPRAKVALYNQLADIAVVPSLYEPFGYTAIEAMAAGTPLIASNIGGLPEIVEDGVSGLLFPVHRPDLGLSKVDVDGLADAQLKLLNDEALAKRIGARGRDQVLSRFKTEHMIDATLAVYDQVLDDHEAQEPSAVTVAAGSGT